MKECEATVESQFSLWFAMLSPVLGILLGMLAAFVFSN